jgi:hypothetical protein
VTSGRLAASALSAPGWRDHRPLDDGGRVDETASGGEDEQQERRHERGHAHPEQEPAGEPQRRLEQSPLGLWASHRGRNGHAHMVSARPTGRHRVRRAVGVDEGLSTNRSSLPEAACAPHGRAPGSPRGRTRRSAPTLLAQGALRRAPQRALNSPQSQLRDLLRRGRWRLRCTLRRSRFHFASTHRRTRRTWPRDERRLQPRADFSRRQSRRAWKEKRR